MTKTELLDYLSQPHETLSDPMEHINTMLPWIGDPDPIVRDKLIYEHLAQATTRLSHSQTSALVSRYVSEEFLFFDIDKTTPHSVLTRTFTLLQLAVVVHLHNRESRLSGNAIDTIAEALIRYLRQETHVQGYHETMGWMHSLAHAADVLGQLLRSSDLKNTRQDELLLAFAQAFQTNQYTFIDHENERFVAALNQGLARGRLNPEQLRPFLRTLADFPPQDDFKRYFRIHTNVSSVLYAMYFLLDEPARLVLAPAMEEALRQARTNK